jgi:hypothetical protein
MSLGSIIGFGLPLSVPAALGRADTQSIANSAASNTSSPRRSISYSGFGGFRRFCDA